MANKEERASEAEGLGVEVTASSLPVLSSIKKRHRPPPGRPASSPRSHRGRAALKAKIKLLETAGIRRRPAAPVRWFQAGRYKRARSSSLAGRPAFWLSLPLSLVFLPADGQLLIALYSPLETSFPVSLAPSLFLFPFLHRTRSVVRGKSNGPTRRLAV